MNKFRFKVSTMLEQVEDDYIKFIGDNYGVNRDEFLKDFKAKLNLESHHVSTVHAELLRLLSIIPYQRNIKTITFGYLLTRETESMTGT